MIEEKKLIDVALKECVYMYMTLFMKEKTIV